MVETNYRVPGQSREWWNSLVDPLKGLGQRIADFFSPESEASGNDSFYEIHVELPGVSEKEIELTVDNNTLLVRGEKKFERTDEGRTYYFSERVYGRFQRTFRLPSDADTSRIDAIHKDGLLTIRIAKRSPGTSQGRKIAVRSTG